MTFKKILAVLLALVLCTACLFACNDTPAGGTGDGGNGGGTTDGGNTDGGNTDGGNTDGGNTDPVPVVLQTLAGKSAVELYEAVGPYLTSLTNATMNNSMKTVIEQGEDSFVSEDAQLQKISANGAYMKSTSSGFGASYMSEVTFIDGVLYETDGETKSKTEMTEWYGTVIEADVTGVEEEYINAITLYEFEGKHYLIVDLKTAVVDSMIDADSDTESAVEIDTLSFRIDLTAEGNFVSAKVEMKFSVTAEGATANYEMLMEMTLSDVGTTVVTAPADADEYEEYDPESDWEEWGW